MIKMLENSKLEFSAFDFRCFLDGGLTFGVSFTSGKISGGAGAGRAGAIGAAGLRCTTVGVAVVGVAVLNVAAMLNATVADATATAASFGRITHHQNQREQSTSSGNFSNHGITPLKFQVCGFWRNSVELAPHSTNQPCPSQISCSVHENWEEIDDHG